MVGMAASRSFDKNGWHMALKIEHGFHPASFDEHSFEEDFDTHGFDFLGHHFAINTSANEEFIHSIFREQFST